MIIGEYSPRGSRGDFPPNITEPEANNCFSIFTSEFTLQLPFYKILLVIFAGAVAASRHFVNLFFLLYSPVGEIRNVISNFTNHNVGFLMFTCVKILTSVNREEK